jgi:hypothetical protein
MNARGLAIKSYYLRWWARSLAETQKIWKSYGRWLVVCALLGGVLHECIEQGWRVWADWGTVVYLLAYSAAVVVGSWLVSAIRAPRLLERERSTHKRLKQATSKFRFGRKTPAEPVLPPPEKAETIAPVKTTAAPSAPPPPIPKQDPPVEIVLRHVLKHRRLVFGTHDPILPAGMTGAQLRKILNALVADQVINRSVSLNSSGGFDYIYEVAPGMVSTLTKQLNAGNRS